MSPEGSHPWESPGRGFTLTGGQGTDNDNIVEQFDPRQNRAPKAAERACSARVRLTCRAAFSMSWRMTRYPLSLLMVFCCLALRTLPAWDGETIVDTTFDQADNTVFATATAPVYDVELPLKAPTKLKASAASGILPGTVQEGPWSPPYTKVTLAPDPERQSPPFALMEWDLKDLPAEAGRYLATFEAMVLDDSGDSGVFVVGLLDAEARSFDGTAATTYPFVSIARKEIGSVKRQRLQVGVPYLIEIMVDTQKNTWSATINGEVVREETPFIQSAIDKAPAGYRLGKLAYAVSVPGFFACKPGGALAIKRVALRKMSAQ
jgi:hypothetical protein